MNFIESVLLWGALAVIIPITIHFWHQKQGKPLPWAATQWLTEKQQQQSRGLRLDNIPLLIIRCLLLILLAFLLAQPILNWFHQPPTIQKVHLVEPNPVVSDNFRFELTEALKKGERVIWANENAEPVTTQLLSPEKTLSFNPLRLQSSINRIDPKNTELHLYISTNSALADVPAITVPARFHLHTVVDSANRPRAYLALKNNGKLFINRAGKLISNPVLDPTLKFTSAPAHSGPIRVLLNYRNGAERQTIKAALAALTDVYGFDFTIDEKPLSNLFYDVLLTDESPVTFSSRTLYIISESGQQATLPNVIFADEVLTPQTSERVSTGQLPEWLGEQLVNFYGIDSNRAPLNQRDLRALFVPSAKPTTAQQAGIQNALLLLFIVLLLLERWLALTKNA